MPTPNIAVTTMINRYTTLLFLIIALNTDVIAQESFELTTEDRQIIHYATQDYNICVQQNAVQQLDNFADIRRVAAEAVQLCEHQLKELKVKLAGTVNAEYYSGLERHIKNRAIRKLLPLLMFEKSSRQAASDKG